MGRITYFSLIFVFCQFSVPVLAQVTSETLLDRILIEDMMFNFYWELTDYSGERDHLDLYYLDDAVMVVNGKAFNGAATIKDAYVTRQNESVDSASTMKMLLGNPRIVIDGETARFDGIWTGILNQNLQSQPLVLEQGTEETTLMKINGQWKIQHRVITSLSNMPEAWDGD